MAELARLGLAWLLLAAWQRADAESDESLTERTEYHLPPSYSKDYPPEGETICLIQWIISDIQKIDQHNQEMVIDLHLSADWKDSRLNGTLRNISLGSDTISKLWVPDITIMNQRGMTFGNFLVEPIQIMLYPGGAIRLAKYFSVRFGCKMDFHRFPFDPQRCRFSVESYRYPIETLKFQWHPTPAPLVVQDIPQDIFKYTVALANISEVDYDGELYPALAFDFILDRQISYYVVQTLLPQMMFVVISWCSFFVPPEVVPGRMTLCITTVLTICTMYSATRNDAPSTSYFKAIDLFGAINISFVFAVLLHYTNILRYLSKDKLAAAVESQARSLVRQVSPKDRAWPPPKAEPSAPAESFAMRSARYDTIAKVLFPLSYLLFVAVFFLYYAL
ncbi:glycine receptor subunit alpha-2-like [Penaeus chinensis]|uniref:glycine receptor subunit alpha-2-like n=1 Tax=Penaeus chinensis TaxID=139456 RepID=UPI001FB6E535|nr:glycine receptor subunit alpha-2-like [Penaeus chinensis]